MFIEKRTRSDFPDGKWMVGARIKLRVAAAMVLLSTATAFSQYLVHHPAKLRWQPAPTSLPPGAEVAVLRGDPTQPGIFTMRLKFPAGFVVSPHWHTQDEHITVISGELKIGMGEKLDRSKTEAISPGSLMVMPATHRHFAYFDQETVLQLHGQGPWVVNYVNPADDPRNKKP